MTVKTEIEFENEVDYNNKVEIEFKVQTPIAAEDFALIQGAIETLNDAFEKYKGFPKAQKETK